MLLAQAGGCSEFFVLFSSAARKTPGVTGWGLANRSSPRNLKTILRPATFPAFTVTTRSSFETCREPMTLILKRARASRPSGQWSDEDYDVLSDGKVAFSNRARASIHQNFDGRGQSYPFGRQTGPGERHRRNTR